MSGIPGHRRLCQLDLDPQIVGIDQSGVEGNRRSTEPHGLLPELRPYPGSVRAKGWLQ